MSQIVSTELDSVNLANLQREGMYGTPLLSGTRYAVVRRGEDGDYLDSLTISHTADGALATARFHNGCMEADEIVSVVMFELRLVVVVPLADVVV